MPHLHLTTHSQLVKKTVGVRSYFIIRVFHVLALLIFFSILQKGVDVRLSGTN